MIWIVKRLWIDPLENRDAYGYDVIGYVTDAAEADRISKLEMIPKSKYPWPLDYHDEPGDYVSRYKVTEIEPFEIILNNENFQTWSRFSRCD